jgi:hypothetical protein
MTSLNNPFNDISFKTKTVFPDNRDENPSGTDAVRPKKFTYPYSLSLHRERHSKKVQNDPQNPDNIFLIKKFISPKDRKIFP